ncbi:MAG: hypothetical protein L3K09_03950 [Thermoplasmata archaeon]|nr:hypothetical protein [Thermoplasmata archaeon]
MLVLTIAVFDWAGAPGASSSPICERTRGPPCVFSSAHTHWALSPPSSWCTAAGNVETCGTYTAVLNANLSGDSTLSGTIEVDGPFEVFVNPANQECELQVHLTGLIHPCPAPYPYFDRSRWDSGALSAGSVDLSGLEFNVTGTLGVLTPGVWSITVVDLSSIPETAFAQSDLMVNLA